MKSKRAVAAWEFGNEVSLPSGVGESRHLLRTLFKSATVGVAICDRQLRYRAVNNALASMNGLPPRAHIGKTIHAVLGDAAAKIQPAFEHVFATGEPVSNLEVTAKLPERAAPGRWSEHYFPLKDASQEVQHVGAVVLELPRREELQEVILQLTSSLTVASSNVRASVMQSGVKVHGLHDSLATSLELLQKGLRQIRTLTELVNSAPVTQALHPAERKAGGFAAAIPVSDALDFIDPLTSREREVIALIASGKSNREISSLLTISKRTVETHRAKIMLKLNLHSLSELVRYALRHRLVKA